MKEMKDCKLIWPKIWNVKLLWYRQLNSCWSGLGCRIMSKKEASCKCEIWWTVIVQSRELTNSTFKAITFALWKMFLAPFEGVAPSLFWVLLVLTYIIVKKLSACLEAASFHLRNRTIASLFVIELIFLVIFLIYL